MQQNPLPILIGYGTNYLAFAKSAANFDWRAAERAAGEPQNSHNGRQMSKGRLAVFE